MNIKEFIKQCDEPIPYYVGYVMNLQQPTEEDIRWAQELVKPKLILVK